MTIVLRVHGDLGFHIGVDKDLDHLPVALVIAEVDAGKIVVVVEEPVLKPRSGEESTFIVTNDVAVDSIAIVGIVLKPRRIGSVRVEIVWTEGPSVDRA